MSYIKKYSILSVLLLYLFACGRDETQRNTNINNYSPGEWSVSFASDLVLKPDLTYNYQSLANYYPFGSDNTETVTTLSDNFIYEFDVSSGDLVSKVGFAREGPNSVPNRHMYDGIVKIGNKEYLLILHWTREIYRINEQGAKMLFQLNPDEEKAFMTYSGVYPVANPNNANEILLSLCNQPRVPAHSKVTTFLKFNYKTQRAQDFIHYPELYDEPYWTSSPYPYIPSIHYIPSKEQYFVSFPLSSKIYIYNDKFELDGTQEVRSKYIEDIKPYLPEKPAAGVSLDWDQARAHFRKMSYYLGLPQKVRFIHNTNKLCW